MYMNKYFYSASLTFGDIPASIAVKVCAIPHFYRMFKTTSISVDFTSFASPFQICGPNDCMIFKTKGDLIWSIMLQILRVA